MRVLPKRSPSYLVMYVGSLDPDARSGNLYNGLNSGDAGGDLRSPGR